MCLYPIQLKVHGKRQLVKCGKCIECMKATTQEWALRIMLEAKEHKDNCCLTLTYNDEHVPDDYELRRKDIQLFLKRLRKHVDPVKVRYFYSGEYGDKLGRPHFHIIIFGWCPNDLQFFKRSKHGGKCYNSPTVNKLWNLGWATVGEVDYETAFYCAKYLQKAKGVIKRVKPFVGMSLKPGIGFNAIHDIDMFYKGVYYNGKKYPLPRYFQKVLEPLVSWQDKLELRLKRTTALNQSLRCRSDESLDAAREREKRLFNNIALYGQNFVLVGEPY